MLPPTFKAANVGKALNARVTGLGVLVEGCWWRWSALEVLRDGLHGISDLSTDGQLLRFSVAVHAVALAAVGTTNTWEVAVLVGIALFHVPEALGEWIFRAFARNSKKRCKEVGCVEQ